MTTLLVTVGSTLFSALSDAALSPPAMAAAYDAGVRKLVVQLGRANVPTALGVGVDGGEADVDVDAAGAAGAGVSTSESKTSSGGRRVLRVCVIRYTSGAGEMDALMRAADAVVSHAGSGTILSALRLPRPLLVVPNAALMDNHQQELADALQAGGYLDVCDVADLPGAIPRLFAANHKAFPPFRPERFQAILDETAGLA